MKKNLFTLFMLWVVLPLFAQTIQMESTASLNQVYGTQEESETLLPMNDLNIEFGYALYQTEINIESEESSLEVENIRDYVAVYVNDQFQGTLTDSRKSLTLPASPGTYTLSLYVENIGRITYGPEILDNSKGIFGEISLDGEPLGNWKITELQVRDCSVNDLVFTVHTTDKPCFHKGTFHMDTPKDIYLNVSGWGMGEVWINGNYMGSYWEEEKQHSILIPEAVWKKGKNEVVVFELKNNNQESVQLSDEPVFK